MNNCSYILIECNRKYCGENDLEKINKIVNNMFNNNKYVVEVFDKGAVVQFNAYCEDYEEENIIDALEEILEEFKKKIQCLKVEFIERSHHNKNVRSYHYDKNSDGFDLMMRELSSSR